jgi:hypothetical protein
MPGVYVSGVMAVSILLLQYVYVTFISILKLNRFEEYGDIKVTSQGSTTIPQEGIRVSRAQCDTRTVDQYVA